MGLPTSVLDEISASDHLAAVIRDVRAASATGGGDKFQRISGSSTAKCTADVCQTRAQAAYLHALSSCSPCKIAACGRAMSSIESHAMVDAFRAISHVCSPFRDSGQLWLPWRETDSEMAGAAKRSLATGSILAYFSELGRILEVRGN